MERDSEGRQPAHSKTMDSKLPQPISVMPKSAATKEITTEGSEISRVLGSRPVAFTEGDGGLLRLPGQGLCKRSP